MLMQIDVDPPSSGTYTYTWQTRLRKLEGVANNFTWGYGPSAGYVMQPKSGGMVTRASIARCSISEAISSCESTPGTVRPTLSASSSTPRTRSRFAARHEPTKTPLERGSELVTIL